MSLAGKLVWLLAPHLAADFVSYGFAAFMEKMGQFNREKTPERVVHARGMVAKGSLRYGTPCAARTVSLSTALQGYLVNPVYCLGVSLRGAS